MDKVVKIEDWPQKLIKSNFSFYSRIKRCYACFKTVPDVSKEFCPKCGNKTLKRVSVTLNADGSTKIHISGKKFLLFFLFFFFFFFVNPLADRTKVHVIFYLRPIYRWYHCLHLKMDSLNFYFESVLPYLHLLWDSTKLRTSELHPNPNNRPLGTKGPFIKVISFSNISYCINCE